MSTPETVIPVSRSSEPRRVFHRSSAARGVVLRAVPTESQSPPITEYLMIAARSLTRSSTVTFGGIVNCAFGGLCLLLCCGDQRSEGG